MSPILSCHFIQTMYLTRAHTQILAHHPKRSGQTHMSKNHDVRIVPRNVSQKNEPAFGRHTLQLLLSDIDLEYYFENALTRRSIRLSRYKNILSSPTMNCISNKANSRKYDLIATMKPSES